VAWAEARERLSRYFPVLVVRQISRCLVVHVFEEDAAPGRLSGPNCSSRLHPLWALSRLPPLRAGHALPSWC